MPSSEVIRPNIFRSSKTSLNHQDILDRAHDHEEGSSVIFDGEWEVPVFTTSIPLRGDRKGSFRSYLKTSIGGTARAQASPERSRTVPIPRH